MFYREFTLSDVTIGPNLSSISIDKQSEFAELVLNGKEQKMWKRVVSDNYAVTGVLLIALVVFGGCGSAPESNDWQTSAITDSGTVDGLPLGSVLIGDAKQVGDDVQIHMVDTLCDRQECRVIAIGVDGRTYVGHRIVTLGATSKHRSMVAVFRRINLEDIQEFQFQARPLEEETDDVVTGRSQLSNAVRKRRLVDEVCENGFVESDSFN